MLPVHLFFVEYLDALHDVVHFEPIKLEESDQKVSSQQLFPLSLVVLILLLDVGYDHQNQPVAADSSEVRSAEVCDVDELL